jgi:hypothetical protein
MGPAGIWTVLYPPRPSSGSKVRFFINHHIVFISSFDTHVLSISQYSICFTESIKYLHLIWFFLFGSVNHLFGYYTLVRSMSMDYITMVGVSFDTRTARVQCRGVVSPPPWSRAPRQESSSSRSIVCTHVLVLGLHNCTMLGV